LRAQYSLRPAAHASVGLDQMHCSPERCRIDLTKPDSSLLVRLKFDDVTNVPPPSFDPSAAIRALPVINHDRPLENDLAHATVVLRDLANTECDDALNGSCAC
jgi:hypothetical protein